MYRRPTGRLFCKYVMKVRVKSKQNLICIDIDINVIIAHSIKAVNKKLIICELSESSIAVLCELCYNLS